MIASRTIRTAVVGTGIVLIVGGAGKTIDSSVFVEQTMRLLHNRSATAIIVAIAAGLDIAVGTLLAVDPRPRSARVAMALLVVYTGWLALIGATLGWDSPCGCISIEGDSSAAIGIARNAFLMLVCFGGVRSLGNVAGVAEHV